MAAISMKSKNWEYILPLGIESKVVLPQLSGSKGTKAVIELMLGKTIESIGTRCYVRFFESKTREQVLEIFPGCVDVTKLRNKPNTSIYPIDMLMRDPTAEDKTSSLICNGQRGSLSCERKSSSVIMSNSSSKEPSFKSLGVEVDTEQLQVDDYIEAECRYIEAVGDVSIVDKTRMHNFYVTHNKMTKERLAEHKYKCMRKGFKSFHDSKCQQHPNAIFEINFEETDYECPACSISNRREKYLALEDEEQREELLSLLSQVEGEYMKGLGSIAFESIPLDREPVDEMTEASFRVEASDYLELCKKESEELITKRDKILHKRTQEVPMTKSDRRYRDLSKKEMDAIIEEAVVEEYMAASWLIYKPKMYEQYKKERNDLDILFNKGHITMNQYIQRDDDLFDQVEEDFAIIVREHASRMREEDLTKAAETLSSAKSNK